MNTVKALAFTTVATLPAVGAAVGPAAVHALAPQGTAQVAELSPQEREPDLNSGETAQNAPEMAELSPQERKPDLNSGETFGNARDMAELSPKERRPDVNSGETAGRTA